jgi:hypothetical protein
MLMSAIGGGDGDEVELFSSDAVCLEGEGWKSSGASADDGDGLSFSAALVVNVALFLYWLIYR